MDNKLDYKLFVSQKVVHYLQKNQESDGFFCTKLRGIQLDDEGTEIQEKKQKFFRRFHNF